jgi:hypothetical protein
MPMVTSVVAPPVEQHGFDHGVAAAEVATVEFPMSTYGVENASVRVQ